MFRAKECIDHSLALAARTRSHSGHSGCASRKSEMRERAMTLLINAVEGSGWPERGDEILRSSHAVMADRSYVWPSHVNTGSTCAVGAVRNQGFMRAGARGGMRILVRARMRLGFRSCVRPRES
eukprot:763790-Pleurochrysis_carterae.AAC.1